MSEPAEVPSVRGIVDNATVLRNLGLLSELSGTWEGEGFNLIARPDFRDRTNLYLQLNQTRETLEITPIGSPIPNRGFGQGDIELAGLSYLDKIHDRSTGGALHLEPGLWITQPATGYPSENPPADGGIVARMATIPHGNAMLAQGNATRFTGPPTLSTATETYRGSVFPSFNSTPFGAGGAINAAGSSEKATAAAIGVPPFGEYDLDIAASETNTRTPFRTSEPDLPKAIGGVFMQDIINDPITLLQAVISQQADNHATFEGVALNIATQKTVPFLPVTDNPKGAPVSVSVADGGGTGNISNTLFLEGGEPGGAAGPNAQTALVYATIWIEKVTPAHGRPFMQLQYAQMTVLNFGIFTVQHPPAGAPPAGGPPAGGPPAGGPPAGGPPGGGPVILGWPHISVATLRKAFS